MHVSNKQKTFIFTEMHERNIKYIQARMFPNPKFDLKTDVQNHHQDHNPYPTNPNTHNL